MDPWISYFGADWRGVVPRYVLAAYGDDSGGWETAAAALTRWRDELAAAEPAEDSPERLRERREALGKDDAWIEHILSALDVGAGPDFGYGRERRIAAEGVSSYTEKSTVTMRAAYAAALSAAEAERAAKPDHLAYADSPVWDDGPLPTPTPERPAPRFKVGDWVRSTVSGEAFEVTGVSVVGESVMPTLGAVYASARCGSWSECYLEPASPPAPEVVDVPQPAPLPKTVAHFYTIRALPEPHRVSWNMPGDGPQWVQVNDALWLHVDDLRAMLADIDAVQQPAPVAEPPRPEPRYKVGDWVRHGGGMPWQVTEVRDYRDCYAYHGALGAFIEGPEVTLSPAIDPALHETARKTVAWLRGGARGTGPADFTTLPGWSDWNSGSRWDAAEHWAAQLERLLVDAP